MDIFEVIGETVVSAVLFIGENAGEAAAEKIAGSNAVSRFPRDIVRANGVHNYNSTYNQKI